MGYWGSDLGEFVLGKNGYGGKLTTNYPGTRNQINKRKILHRNYKPMVC